MTIHFSHFDDSPSALEDLNLSRAEKDRLAALIDLTGCPMARVIDGVCQEPGCQSRGLQFNEVVLSQETCRRLEEAVKAAAMDSGPGETGKSEDSLSNGIFHTEGRLRCVL